MSARARTLVLVLAAFAILPVLGAPARAAPSEPSRRRAGCP